MASDAAASKSILIRMAKCSCQIHKCDCFNLLGLSGNCSDKSENWVFIIFSKVGMGVVKVFFFLLQNLTKSMWWKSSAFFDPANGGWFVRFRMLPLKIMGTLWLSIAPFQLVHNTLAATHFTTGAAVSMSWRETLLSVIRSPNEATESECNVQRQLQRATKSKATQATWLGVTDGGCVH